MSHEDGGNVRQPVAEHLRPGLCELAVEADHLRPGEVLGEPREGRVLESSVLPAPDPVLDAGMAAMAALECCGVDLEGTRVRDEARVPKVLRGVERSRGEDARAGR